MDLAVLSAPSLPMMELCACTFMMVICLSPMLLLILSRILRRRGFRGWYLMSMGCSSMFLSWWMEVRLSVAMVVWPW